MSVDQSIGNKLSFSCEVAGILGATIGRSKARENEEFIGGFLFVGTADQASQNPYTI